LVYVFDNCKCEFEVADHYVPWLSQAFILTLMHYSAMTIEKNVLFFNFS